MSHTYYIAADGGGSKLLGILYDDEFHIVRYCKLSGVNANFKPVEMVRKNLSDMLDLLLGEDITEVEAADVCLVCSETIWRSIIAEDPRIKSVVSRDEPRMALGAACLQDGIVALSGTGSDVFMLADGNVLGAVGGWGPLLGDEGSGYDIGLRALKAAVYDVDGCGEKTVLTDMVMKKWNLDTLERRFAVEVSNDPDSRHTVASVAKLAAQAANEGDKVACDIYTYAADELFRQTVVLIRRFTESWNRKVVIVGGAWKGYHGMLDRYRERMLEAYPDAEVLEPLFEPVVGCVALRCFDRGMAVADFRDKLMRGFNEYVYKKV